ncbi:MAG: MerR family transcriptional regulator [Cellulosilyticaceae bacterium]
MMDTRFSIGEVSKLHNVSVQALRLYDKKGILKPAYVDEKSNYRYYSVKHFIVLDFIKQCKAMGLSLDEIKSLLSDYTGVDSILHIISQQKEIITAKIQQLEAIERNISFLENRIQGLLEEGIGEVFIKHNGERKFIKYSNAKRYTEEFEINLTKTLGDIEKKYGMTNRELVFATSYESLKHANKLTYDNMMISIPDTHLVDENKMITLKEGDYVTINFDDDYTDTSQYYRKLLAYIEANGIKVRGDCYEIYVMTRVGIDQKEKALGQIQILVDQN